jgi:dipeptidyl aminopeptidase/acylaminoacyl peptidase
MSTDTTFTVDAMLRLPRLSGLALSPDGSRLVVSAARPEEKGRRFVSVLYELDPHGGSPPRRLTRSAPGESGATFAPDGSILFVSARPDPEAGEEDPRGEKPALWRLPAGGGEAYLLAGPPGGVEGIAVGREAGTIVFAADSHPNTGGWEEDAEREKARKDAGVGAQLFTEYPIRFWDHYLGPRERHLHLAPLPDGDAPTGAGEDLIPSPGRSLDQTDFDITPDGSTVVATRWREAGGLRQRFQELVAVDVASGEVRVLAGDEASYADPACSPDGRRVAAVRWGLSTPEEPADQTVWLVDLQSGEGRDLLEGFDRWPEGPVWASDAGALFFTAHDEGNAPVFRVDAQSGEVTRLSGEGAFSDLCPSPDGRSLYALRSTICDPPHPVVIDLEATETRPRRLRSFEELDRLKLEARLERVTATAGDGTRVPFWLLLPPSASAEAPAPLATFIHGGPLNSWNAWHWRWNPHVFVEDAWAILLPDPALSTGYGLDYIRRGWGRWGEIVYADIMSAVDAAAEREDIDAERTAAMGGSFGGYMANWIAGHTDHFGAIVTHASLWDLGSFHGATDLGSWWEREFGDPYEDDSRYRENSPRPHVKNIRTPMLVIHGELDYRVPVGEALRLWTDLKRNGVEAKFLYFPDEHHWVAKPNNARIWYQAVLRFIDHHARGREWNDPDWL